MVTYSEITTWSNLRSKKLSDSKTKIGLIYHIISLKLSSFSVLCRVTNFDHPFIKEWCHIRRDVPPHSQTSRLHRTTRTWLTRPSWSPSPSTTSLRYSKNFRTLPLFFSQFLISYSFLFSVLRIRIIWCGSADPLPGWWIRIRVWFWIRIRPKIEQIPIFFCIRFKTHNDIFCCCNFELIIRVYETKYVISFFLNYIFIILVDLYASLSRFFFCTRIQINVSWSGSWPMIRIRPDPDPKHCLFYNYSWSFSISA